jgi:hypothetical protein
MPQLKKIAQRWFLLPFFLISATYSLAQEELDYNKLYQFPFSFGLEYQNLTPFAEYGGDYQAYEVSAIFRLPIPSIPAIQPLIQAGMMYFDSRDGEVRSQWDHTHLFGTLGVGYANRFSKNFEVGVELTLGASEAIFPNLDSQPRGSPNLLASLGGRISLDPSYNTSIDIHPSLKYLHSLSPLDKYNGLILGIGFTANYRLGEDPDAAQSIIRSIKFGEAKLPDLFAAMQSYYVENSIGQIEITNTDKYALNNLSIAFFQKGFMDSPTVALNIPELAPGESRSVDLFASFNSQIFTTEGRTPLTGDIVVDYTVRGKAAHQTQPVSYYLQDKTALTWDDDRKVAAFITPADSALRNYTSFIRQTTKESVVPGFSEALQIAMQVYSALTEIGCLYQVDPISPYTAAQDDPLIVDSISLPRSTLSRGGTGDCDDLTVLYASLLETAGIETAFMTTPGHIYAAFNTGVQPKDYRSVHPDKNMMLNIEGNLWVPVEITLLGKDDFLAAWRIGMEQYRALDDQPDLRGFYFTRKAQQTYWPVGLRETDLGLQYGSSENIVSGFESSIEKLTDVVLQSYLEAAQKSGNKRDYNRLGIVSAQFGRYEQAEKAFNTALSLDRNYLFSHINMGTLYFLKEEYQAALKSFHWAEEKLLETGKKASPNYLTVLLNISRSYYELENYDRSSDYFEKVTSIDPEKADSFSYLGSTDAAGGRAAEIGASEVILFAAEEE